MIRDTIHNWIGVTGLHDMESIEITYLHKNIRIMINNRCVFYYVECTDTSSVTNMQ